MNLFGNPPTKKNLYMFTVFLNICYEIYLYYHSFAAIATYSHAQHGL